MSCLNSIFQVWSDKGFAQGEKNTGGDFLAAAAAGDAHRPGETYKIRKRHEVLASN